MSGTVSCTGFAYLNVPKSRVVVIGTEPCISGRGYVGIPLIVGLKRGLHTSLSLLVGKSDRVMKSECVIK
jgi:hypothetical protein